MMAILISAVLMASEDVSVYAPTPPHTILAMLLLAGTTEDDVLYDLGSGDGRILVLASGIHGCRSVGIELDGTLVGAAKRNVANNHVGDLVRVYKGDVLQTDFSEATVVTAYLMPNLLAKLKPQFAKLKPGARIVCYDKAIPGAKPTRVMPFAGKSLYLYRIPLVAIRCVGGT